MKYLSTRNSAIRESFSNVLFQGLSKEGGLFLPESWPNIDIKNLKGKSYNDVAFNIINPFLDDDISREDIFKIIFNTYDNFNHPNIEPLVEISEKTKSQLVNVFVPTTPNPTSGFLLMFPKNEIIYLDMSFEEASKFIVSAGTSDSKSK